MNGYTVHLPFINNWLRYPWPCALITPTSLGRHQLSISDGCDITPKDTEIIEGIVRYFKYNSNVDTSALNTHTKISYLLFSYVNVKKLLAALKQKLCYSFSQGNRVIHEVWKTPDDAFSQMYRLCVYIIIHHAIEHLLTFCGFWKS